MIFQTPRLTIRDLTLDDIFPYHEMQGNPKVMQYTGSPPETFEESKKSLIKCIDCYQQPDNTFWVWAIDEKESDTFIGTCAIIVDESGKGEIGYRILEKYWGNGFATEIIQPLIDFGFSKMKLSTIFATVDRLNIASVKMLEKSELEFIKEEWSDKYQSTDRYYEKTKP